MCTLLLILCMKNVRYVPSTGVKTVEPALTMGTAIIDATVQQGLLETTASTAVSTIA
jgi:hypothetical protein